MIVQKIKRRPQDFVVLFIILLSGLFGYFAFSFDPHWQRRIIYATSGLYFLWSLYHHYRKGDLDLSIIVEYLVLVILALVVISSTLFR